MKTSFIAFMNFSGIACASSSDSTIYKISNFEPLAIAASPNSKIPWSDIINQYIRLGEPLHHSDFKDYAIDFGNFLSSITIPETIEDLSDEDKHIIFLGYGTDDIFPSIFDVLVKVDNYTGTIIIESHQQNSISHNNSAAIHLLGNFDSVAPIIWGTTQNVSSALSDSFISLSDKFISKVVDRFKGTEFIDTVNKQIAMYKASDQVSETIDASIDKIYNNNVCMGITSFSIEDMVSAAETIVNANVRLNHLRSGDSAIPGETKEIAVITRVEGVKWIKHSIFAI